ncbi:MAG: hypothetical protein ACP5MD_10305, partial [Verrucomicrobiia bacterium]
YLWAEFPWKSEGAQMPAALQPDVAQHTVQTGERDIGGDFHVQPVARVEGGRDDQVEGTGWFAFFGWGSFCVASDTGLKVFGHLRLADEPAAKPAFS